MGDRLPRPIQRQPGKVITDDLDFSLLQLASDYGIGLNMFDWPDLGEYVNRHVAEHTRPELIAALAELFARGDIEAEAELPYRSRRYRCLRLNADEIEAGMAGAIRMTYYLTPQGGERWARHAGVDWQRWDGDQSSTTNYGQITTASREFSEFLFEREVRSGQARGPGKWREVRPWNATYWHVEPVGNQVRYRLTNGERIRSDRFVWEECLRRPGQQPVDLVPRSQREMPVRARPLGALSEEQLDQRMFDRSPLTRLAACSERARRAVSAKQLSDQLNTRCPIQRYCAARALGERKAVEAIPALLGVVFNQHDVAAVEALGEIGDARVLEPLLVVYEHWQGESSFRVALERVVVRFGDPAVARIEQLQEEGRISSTQAWDTLGRSTSRRAVEFLARHMRDHDYPVMGLLARMGDEARALLFAVATGEHEKECDRRSAARQLARTAGVFQEEARRIVAGLTESPKENHLRRRVAWFVTRDADAEVVDPVAAVLAMLRRSDAHRRRIAVDLLVELDARQATGDIAGLATDENWMVRASVARALTRWAGPEPVLAELRKDPDVIVRGCTLWFEDAG